MNLSRGLLVLAALAATLTGCTRRQEAAPAPPPLAPPAPAPASPAEPTPPPPPPKPTPPPLKKTTKPAQPPLTPENLVGLNQTQISALLGPAGEIVEQSPATVWTYQAPGCRLQLYFYLDLQTSQMRTLSYDLKAATPAHDAAVQCLSKMRSVQ